MTKKEHLLMIMFFSKQAQFLKTILSILQSRGIVESDDPRAFEFATRTDAASNAALLVQSTELYLRIAKGLGIDTQIEPPPHP